MATNSINNFLVDSPNTNNFDDFMSLFGSLVRYEGVINGFYIKANGSNNSISLRWSDADATSTNQNIPGATKTIIGTAALSLSNIMRPVWEVGTVERILDVNDNNDPGIRFDLVCIKQDDTLLTTDIVIVPGDVGIDPNLAALESSTVKYLPIGRIRVPGSLGIITQGNIDQKGTCNSGDFRTIRPIALGSLSGAPIFTASERTAANLADGAIFVQRDSLNDVTFKVFDEFRNIDISLKQNTKVLYELLSPVSLGTYSALSAIVGNTYQRVPRVSPNTVFDNILPAPAPSIASGSLTVPANTLKAGDKLEFNFIYDFSFTASSASSPSLQWYTNTIKLNNVPLGLGGVELRDGLNILKNVTSSNEFFGDLSFSSTGTTAGSPVNNKKISFKMILEIIKTGSLGFANVSIKQRFFFYNESNNSFFTLRNLYISELGHCDINTTINNTVNIDFGAFRRHGGGIFNPTIFLDYFSLHQT